MYELIVNYITSIITGVNANETMSLHEFLSWFTTRARVESMVNTGFGIIIAVLSALVIGVVIYKTIELNKKNLSKEEA